MFLNEVPVKKKWITFYRNKILEFYWKIGKTVNWEVEIVLIIINNPTRLSTKKSQNLPLTKCWTGAYVSTFAKPSLTALILALYNSHYDEYIVIALHLICKLLFTLLQKCIVEVFENVLYVSIHCIFWIFEKHTVREYLPYTSNKRKSLKNEKSFVRSRISQENIQSKILHLSSHFCSQLSSKNVLHKSFESCIFAWGVCLHRNYILLQLLEVCSFFYGQNFSHLLQK